MNKLQKLTSITALTTLITVTLVQVNAVEAVRERQNQANRVANLIATNNWRQLPGKAKDVGDHWVIGTDRVEGGYKIYRWRNNRWQEMPGSGVRIGGNKDNPLVVNDKNEIYRWDGRDWEKMPGSARDVGDDWVIGTERTSGGYKIYRWYQSRWEEIPGSGVRIGGNKYNPWVVNEQNEIFRREGSSWRRIEGSAKDVANNWALGIESTEGGYHVYHWTGSRWDEIPGAGISIGGDRNKPWVVNDREEIYVLE